MPAQSEDMQRRLTISESSDAYELEASRVAREVVHGKQNGRNAEDPAKSSVSAEPRARGPHSPARRALNQVRIHNDGEAGRSAQTLNSLAYTVQNHIVFAPGEFSPNTAAGKELLGHELVHVFQQSRGPTAERILQRKERAKWALEYKTNKEATDARKRLVESFGLEAEDPVQGGKKKLWTFHYFKMNQAEAEALAKEKEKYKSKGHSITVEHDRRADSYYVKVIANCPDAIPEKKDYKVWERCFPTESGAKRLAQRFAAAHLETEVYTLEKGKYGLYYKPMAKATAEKAGQEAAEAREGFMEGLYKIATKESKELKSYVYSIKTECPKGYVDLGAFLITAYALAQENEFAEKPTVKDPCGLKGTFRRNFLFETKTAPRGVKMQGSGLSSSGKLIHYKGNNCFEEAPCALTHSRTCATVGRTVAVDEKVIPMGKELLIEDVGSRTAEDTGRRIKDKRVDVYVGTDMTLAEAEKQTKGSRKVCRKK